MNEAIEIENLCLPYIRKTVNLELNRGLNYIKGRNGTGKTLLLDYISGIRKEKKANILGNTSVIYINQSIFFSDRLIGEDFLRFVYRLGCKKQKVSYFWEFIEKFYDYKWGETEVKELLKKQWGMMSGGEKKFIYIVILLSIEREWYILDEPFAFLDKDKKDIIWKMINEKISKKKGIILTSHEREINNLNAPVNVVDMDVLESKV